METWNRDDLYVEVWERPQVKVAAKYGISAVMPQSWKFGIEKSFSGLCRFYFRLVFA